MNSGGLKKDENGGGTEGEKEEQKESAVMLNLKAKMLTKLGEQAKVETEKTKQDIFYDNYFDEYSQVLEIIEGESDSGQSDEYQQDSDADEF